MDIGINNERRFAKGMNCRLPLFFGVDMKLTNSKQFLAKDFAILLLLLVCSNKWLLEGILDMPILELAALLGGLAITLVHRKWKIGRDSLMWLVFCFSIVLSLCMNGDSVNTWGRAGIMLAICLYAVVYPYQELDFRFVTGILLCVAVFHAVAVMLQYFFLDEYKALYYPLLSDTILFSAKRYISKGYYFGVMSSPHEVAGILMFTIVLLLARIAVLRRAQIWEVLLAIFLIPPMLLTGKKGVAIVFVIVTLLCATILYWSKKDRRKIILIYAVGGGAAVAMVAIILMNPDNPLFSRFATFFSNLLSGKQADSGRTALYNYAIEAWKENPLFGIGWYQFTRRTTELYGYSASHQVNLDYLQWLAELGVFGFILNMIPISVTLYQTVHICKKKLRGIENHQEQIKVLFAVFVQFFTLIYAFVEVPFYDMFFFAMYILSCVIINGYYRSLKGSHSGGRMYLRLKMADK